MYAFDTGKNLGYLILLQVSDLSKNIKTGETEYKETNPFPRFKHPVRRGNS